MLGISPLSHIFVLSNLWWNCFLTEEKEFMVLVKRACFYFCLMCNILLVMSLLRLKKYWRFQHVEINLNPETILTCTKLDAVKWGYLWLVICNDLVSPCQKQNNERGRRWWDRNVLFVPQTIKNVRPLNNDNKLLFIKQDLFLLKK